MAKKIFRAFFTIESIYTYSCAHIFDSEKSCRLKEAPRCQPAKEVRKLLSIRLIKKKIYIYSRANRKKVMFYKRLVREIN